MSRPDIEQVRSFEAWLARTAPTEHLLTFQGILRSHEDLYGRVNELEGR